MLRRQARFKKLVSLCLSVGLLFSMLPTASAVATEKDYSINNVSANQTYKTIGKVAKITKEQNNVYLDLETGEKIKINFLKNNVFRLHLDPKGIFEEYPTPNEPEHVTKIIDKNVSDYKKQYGEIDIKVDDRDNNVYKISTDSLELRVDKTTSKMSLYDKKRSKILWSESEPLKHSNGSTVQTLDTKENEYFYGGGQQNGFYAHKNNSINIAIGGGWDAGAASSPVPFYLSTEGYGVMRNTFKPGVYDFTKTAAFTHNEDRFDAYYFVDDSLPNIIDEYTELTGEAALMPKYGFYLGHADCFNGTHNGHKDQRTLLQNGFDTLNQYVENDMPLGWFLPNDGYGCGYGGLDNLEQFVDKANDQKVEVGLWTQSNLYPDPSLPPDSPLLRDLDGEVKAGVRAIKTDVAWVGHGYSMALNATRQAAEGIQKEENSGGARPFVISLDGWAGTQRYATLWSGDQYGGNWEYIRMHIPTYIGAGLSGNPNVGSDMDGIFGGDPKVQTRDFQWKAFTPIQIDMDGWASGGTDYSKSKNPWNYGEPYASINRMYLKLKSQMMPYIYTIAKESTAKSMPMVRGMMLEYPNDPYTYGTETQYQYMWGPNLLVAPIYDGNSNADEVRNDIYLPDKDQVWIDYFTGEQYQGGSVLHNFNAPLWKTPVFVKAGAINPMAPENNSINELNGSENRIFDVYPSGKSEFTLYEDDGKTVEYKEKKNTRTKVTSKVIKEKAVITVNSAKGKGYKGMVKNRGTEVIVNTRVNPRDITVKVGNKDVPLRKVTNEEEYKNSENVYFYNEQPNLNKYSTKGSPFEKTDIITSPKLYIKVGKTDITKNKITVTVDGFDNTQKKDVVDKEVPTIPSELKADEANITDRDIKLNWNKVDGSNVTYDLMINGIVHTNVFKSSDSQQVPFYLHSGLVSDTEYSYRIRATNTKGSSGWSDEIKIRTKLDRYRNVPKNITAKADSEQPGQEASLAVDGKDETLWHTAWGDAGNKLPHTFEIDMKLAYDLDKLEYVPRPDAGNGTILKYNLDVSLDGKTYKNIITDGTFERNNQTKVIDFNGNVTARYIKLTITSAVGGYGSAQEFRPYKKDKTTGTVVGENIPNGVIDEDDLLFFASYMGVDQTDTAWGQVSKVDINFNGVIDAYDLMYVASQLGKNPLHATGRPVGGLLDIRPSKQQLKAGEEFSVEIIGAGLKDINAFNLELKLDPNKYEVVKECKPDGTCGENIVSPANETTNMLNYSLLAGIGNAEQRIMAAFSNKGTQNPLEGTKTLATIKLKAKKDIDFDMPITRSLLINTAFSTIDKIGEVLNPGQEPGDVEQPQEPNELQLSNKDMAVTGDGAMMEGGAAAFAKLIDGEISESSLAELKWSLTEQDGISLPLPVDFNYNKPQELTKFIVYNRPQYTNGKIKTLSAKAYTEAGKEYDLGAKTVQFDDKSVIFDLAEAAIPTGTKFTKLSINFEESHSGPLMLSVAEVEFFAKNPAYLDK
ncbi:discoidin domain-containing protein [Neobacillus niacini]|uniref:discoidin domain-containing protein n=1 Tax=Neobacillus niacini TaxID=86668 RepID=UPI002FFF7EB8